MATPIRYFVTGTDTGVGKTAVAVALLESLVAQGQQPFALKPYESGGSGDGARLRRAAGGWQSLESVTLFRFRAPLAPALAARQVGQALGDTLPHVLKAFRALRGPGVVEGAGGLFVPVDECNDVVDLAVALALPTVVVARAGLGTINHTTLTLEALARRGVSVRGVVLVQATRGRDASVRLNRAELARRFPRVTFVGPVPFIAGPARRRRVLRAAVEPLVAPQSRGQPT